MSKILDEIVEAVKQDPAKKLEAEFANAVMAAEAEKKRIARESQAAFDAANPRNRIEPV